MAAVSTGVVYFYPETNSTLVCTSVSANVLMGNIGDVLVVQNVGAVEAFIAWGDATVVATAGGAITASATGGFPIQPGAIMTLRANSASNSSDAQTSIAGITNAGTTTLRLARGTGQ